MLKTRGKNTVVIASNSLVLETEIRLRLKFHENVRTIHFLLKFVTSNPRMSAINLFILKYLKQLEMTGVIMRISSFSVVSWMGADSPFMYVWMLNTVDAILLTWCAILKKDAAYSLLNGFWILVGLVGILRAGAYIH